LSFDEATAKYGGRMTHLKHVQTRYKPYDGIRLYSLNASSSGYTQNFRVDLRDGTSVATMLKGCLTPFEKLGYNVWGDNAFVSVAMLRYCREAGINFAGTSRTTYGFPEALIDEDLSMGKWKWLMAPPGILAAYWSDVGFVKLMSNWHTPETGMVLRRVSGQADREERNAPEVGAQYNDKMGGTDLKDMMRGIYTVARRGKKWWKTLWYWMLDASMYNALVLHKWCHAHLGLPYKLSYAQFIRKVCDHYLLPSANVATGEVSRSSRVASRRSSASAAKRRILASPEPVNRCSVDGGEGTTPRRSNRTSIDVTSTPNTPQHPITTQESNSALRRLSYCPGYDLVKRPQRCKKNPNKVLPSTCKYCYNAHDAPERNTSTWMCRECKVTLCVGCNYRYHRWVRSAHL
jgi:hypothetical protein